MNFTHVVDNIIKLKRYEGPFIGENSFELAQPEIITYNETLWMESCREEVISEVKVNDDLDILDGGFNICISQENENNLTEIPMFIDEERLGSMMLNGQYVSSYDNSPVTVINNTSGDAMCIDFNIIVDNTVGLVVEDFPITFFMGSWPQ